MLLCTSRPPHICRGVLDQLHAVPLNWTKLVFTIPRHQLIHCGSHFKTLLNAVTSASVSASGRYSGVFVVLICLNAIVAID